MFVKKILNRVISQMGYTIQKKRKLVNNSVLLSELLGHKIPLDYPDFLIKGINLITQLKIIQSFSLDFLNGEWICRIEGLTIIISSWEELLIINEIFVEGVYNVQTTQPFSFIDIGMNVGITSLFFANKSMCEKIIAFEPFQPTLISAKRNFAHNKISSKIKLKEIGLGYPARVIEVDYSEEYKGSVGLNGVASYIGGLQNTMRLQLNISDVYEELVDIVNATDKIILKIDCEGAEYEILERLDNTGLLNKFDIIMIEWHYKGSTILKKILQKNDFELLSINEHRSDIGMIYAFKR